MSERDPVEEQLRSLPPLDLEPDRAERLRRMSLRALSVSVERQRHPRLRAWLDFYGRFLETPLLTGAAAVYLVWAFGFCALLLMT